MKEFISQCEVFTVEELNRFLHERGSGKPNTRKSLLTYYRNQGRLIRVRRGLYATVPLGADPATTPIDPFLIAAKMTSDAVLAYHTALEFHGKAYSVYSKLFYTSANRSLPLEFRSNQFISVPVPRTLRAKQKEMYGVTCHKRAGVELKVTNLERTFVDVLNRPDLSGSWEEIWRSLESIEFFDIDQVIEYTRMLENATTAAKVGFFLEQHRESLMVGESHLEPLKKLRPQQPHYMMRRKRKGCQWVKNWNLMVPTEILNKSWEEVI